MMESAHATKHQAKTEFESWARTYDRSLLNHFLFRPSCFMLLEELAKWQRDGGRALDLLDIGCGTGSLAHLVVQSSLRVRHVIGLDYAMEMCQQAQAKLSLRCADEKVSFINGDSEHLPFGSETFDVITCANSFHHYPHQQAVVHEMRRLLRPGGRLMIIDGFRDNTIGWVVFDVIIASIEKLVHHASWTRMHQFFEAAGFEDIYHRKFNFWFPAFVTVGTA